MPRGHLGPARDADGRGRHALPDVDPRVADDAHVRAVATARDRRPRCATPSSPARDGRRARRSGARRTAARRRAAASSRSIPCRYSTTTPSARRSSPHTFSTSSASWRPSTRMRLARAVRARASAAAKDPDAVRRGPAGAAGSRAATSTTSAPSIRKPGPSGNSRRRPVRSSSSTIPDATPDHRAAVAVVGHLDDEIARGLDPGQLPLRAAAAIPRRARPCRSDRPCVLRIGKATGPPRRRGRQRPAPSARPGRAHYRAPCPACIDSRGGPGSRAPRRGDRCVRDGRWRSPQP